MALIKKVEFNEKCVMKKCMASSAFREPLRKINDNYLKVDLYIKQLENKIKTIQEKEKSRYIEMIDKARHT